MKKFQIKQPLPLRILLVPLLAASLVLAGCGSDNDADAMETGNTTTDGETGTEGGEEGTGTEGGEEGTGTEGGEEGTGTEGGEEGTGTEGGEEGTDNEGTGDSDASSVIITTVASDFSSSALEIYNVAEPREGSSGLNPGVSDTIVRAFEDKYYVIRRFMSDSIAAYNSSDTSTPVFESSTNDGADPASSNPHDLVFVNSEKAYLLRYGSPIIWVVNPSAATAGEFKTGEIDLSAYDADGVPEATRGMVVGDRLFVFMQRLEAFAPTQPGYVAVIDTTTDNEIDTGNGGDLNGIELPAFNPLDISFDAATNSIFVAAVGDYGAFDGSRPGALTGGILTVDTTDLSAEQLIDDTEETGRITAVEVIDMNTAYMITETAFQSSTLVKFNPGTGVIDTTGVAGYADVDIRDIAKGPAGNLWVAIGSTESPKVVVLNPADDTMVGSEISTSLTPTGIAFVQ